MQFIDLNQLNLKVNSTYEKDEKITTNYEPSNDENVAKKTSLDTNFPK